MLPHRRLEIGLGIRLHRRHLLHVLRGLFGQDAYGIVEGDDAHDAALGVHHRYGDEPVAPEQVRGVFPVVRRLHRDEIRPYERRDGLRALVREQVLRRHDAQELVPLHGVAGVDRLAVDADPAYLLQGARDGHVRVELHELHRHDAADAVVRVLQQVVYRLARVRVHVLEQLRDEIRRHVAQEIRRIVREELLKQALYLGARKGLYELLPQVVVHVGERLRRLGLVKDAEHHCELAVVQLREQLREVNGVVHGQHVVDGPEPLLLEQGPQHSYSHGNTLLPGGKKPPRHVDTAAQAHGKRVCSVHQKMSAPARPYPSFLVPKLRPGPPSTCAHLNLSLNCPTFGVLILPYSILSVNRRGES